MCLGGLEHVWEVYNMFGRSITCVWEIYKICLGGLEHMFGRSITCVWEI